MITLKRSIFAAMVTAVIAAPAMMMGAGNATTETLAADTLTVGDQAPAFTLKDLDGKSHTLADYTSAGKTVVLEWYSPSCPFVKKHYRDDTGTMLNIQASLEGQDVVWLRINSARADHPSADMDMNRKMATEWGITTPILMDPTGKVGKSYNAKRTPEMYIITESGTLVYHGAIDNDSKAQNAGDENYVADALVQVMGGQEVSKATTKAYGCSVKY